MHRRPFRQSFDSGGGVRARQGEDRGGGVRFSGPEPLRQAAPPIGLGPAPG